MKKSIKNRIAKKISNQNSNDYDVIDVLDIEQIGENEQEVKKKLKTSTINAYEKWNERELEVKEKIDDNEEIEYNFDMFKNLYTQMKTADGNSTALHHLDIFDEYAIHKKRYRRYNYDNTIYNF